MECVTCCRLLMLEIYSVLIVLNLNFEIIFLVCVDLVGLVAIVTNKITLYRFLVHLASFAVWNVSITRRCLILGFLPVHTSLGVLSSSDDFAVLFKMYTAVWHSSAHMPAGYSCQNLNISMFWPFQLSFCCLF